VSIVNYQIAITYRCNLSCKYCYQMFDVLPSRDAASDITIEDVLVGARLIRDVGITIGKMRLTGGEPMLHQKIYEIYDLVMQHWKPTTWCRTYTSNVKHPTAPKPKETNNKLFLSVKSPHDKTLIHWPVLISPMDCGMQPQFGFNGKACNQQSTCGRLFDVNGFAACPMAGALGRLFDVNTHYTAPVSWSTLALCQHCIHSLPNPVSMKLKLAVKEGSLEYPTKTYREFIKKRRVEKYIEVPCFRERLGNKRFRRLLNEEIKVTIGK